MGERGCDIVVVGGAATDYLAHGGSLPSPGGSAPGDAFLASPGGKGVNAAIAATRLGARVALIACVGGDERGRRILHQLSIEAVITRHVRADPAAETGATVIQTASHGGEQTVGVPGANRSLHPGDVRAAERLIAGARVLVAQLEPPLEAVAEAIRLARKHNVLTVLDPAPPRELPDELLRGVGVVKPNAHEAEALTGVEVRDRSSARRSAEILVGRGAGAAAVEAGSAGTLLLDRTGEYWLPRLPVDSVDPTGAGDAFAAGLAVGLAEGRSLPDAGTFANAAAALTTTRIGAYPALPTRAAVLALLEACSQAT